MTPRKMKPRPTINEVARRAGVAKTTVSHAISGKRPVAPATRERIFKAMHDFKYSPSPIARRLATSLIVGRGFDLRGVTLGNPWPRLHQKHASNLAQTGLRVNS